VLDLDVKCPYNSRGCEFVGNLSRIAKHKTTCVHAIVTCRRCMEEMQAKDAQLHQLERCLRRDTECMYCSKTIAYEEVKTHLNEDCTQVPLDCPNDCGVAPMLRAQLKGHTDDICPSQPCKCRYFECGCTELIARRDMKEHMKDAQHHLSLVEAHSKAQLEAAKIEQLDMIRFVMEVGSLAKFLHFLTDSEEERSAESISVVLQGMKLYMHDSDVQQLGCKALLTMCEVDSKQADQVISAMADNNALDVAMTAMSTHPASSKIHEYALHILRKMATNSKVKTYVQSGNLHFIQTVLDVMKRFNKNIAVQRDAVGVLLNMAVNDTIEVAIGQMGGIRTILCAMDTFAERASLSQLACHAVFHLTFDDGNKDRLVRAGALHRLVFALRTHIYHQNTVYYSLRAIAQLAKIDEYRDRLRRLGVIRLAKFAVQQHASHKDLKKKVKLLILRLSTSSTSSQ
jgi:TRAF-type zinc finger